MTSKQSPQVEEIRRKIEIASEAVSAISDQSLKAIAFQTVLQRLLTSEDLPTSALEAPKPPQQRVVPQARRPKGPKGRIEELVTEGFFRQKRTIAEVKQELAAHGWFHTVNELNPSLLRLVKERKLRRVKEPVTKGGKLAWRYSEW